jgi:predicted CXXCH cytochrome family protein
MIKMKKYLIAMLLGLVLVLALATTIALADNGPHGGFSANTDACAGCHRLHSAQVGSNELLIAASAEATCMSCHDGTGAGTNVEDGVYLSSGRVASGFGADEGDDLKSLLAGGFTNALMATSWSGKYAFDSGFNAVSGGTTSRHLSLTTPATGTIWGSGAENTSNGEMDLECTSCHDPHGNAGWDTSQTPDVRVPSYRLLRWQPSGSNGFTAPASTTNWTGGGLPANDSDTATGWLVPDNQLVSNTEWYTIGTQVFNGTGPFANGDYSSGNGAGVYRPSNGSATVDYIPAAINLPFFCAQCHDRYFNNSRLRNDTDASVYCGAPYADMTLSVKNASQATVIVALTPFADADGAAPYIHPNYPTRCEPVLNSDGTLASWGDNGNSGDSIYTYRHASGDVRYSADGANSQGTDLVGGTTALGATLKVNTGKTVTSISRSCVACHVAHGTTAVANTLGGVDAGAVGVGSLAGGSVLLRMDGRSICLRCHAPNYTIATSASPYTSGLGLTGTSGTAMGNVAFTITNSGTAFSTSTNPGVSGVRFVYTNGAGVLTNSNYSLSTSASSGKCLVAATTISCKTAEGYGTANVYVLSTGNVLSALVGTYTFGAVAAPSITTVSGSPALMAGNEVVTITGFNFTDGLLTPAAYTTTSVMFGFRSYTLAADYTAKGTCQVVSNTTITCRTIATYAGTIDVKVTTTGGQFATKPFTFAP